MEACSPDGARVIVILTVLMKSEPSSPLRLALVGMSGAGKTFWAKRLAAEGWTAISCDDRIEEKLALRLAAGGFSGINGVAAWLALAGNPKHAWRVGQYPPEEKQPL